MISNTTENVYTQITINYYASGKPN